MTFHRLIQYLHKLKLLLYSFSSLEISYKFTSFLVLKIYDKSLECRVWIFSKSCYIKMQSAFWIIFCRNDNHNFSWYQKESVMVLTDLWIIWCNILGVVRTIILFHTPVLRMQYWYSILQFMYVSLKLIIEISWNRDWFVNNTVLTEADFKFSIFKYYQEFV